MLAIQRIFNVDKMHAISMCDSSRNQGHHNDAGDLRISSQSEITCTKMCIPVPKTLSDPPLRTCDPLQLESKFARQRPRLTERIVPSLACSKGPDTLCRPPFLRQRKVAVEHHKCSILLFEGTTNNNGNDPLFPLCRSDRLLCAGISRSGIAQTSHLIKYPTATPLHLENTSAELDHSNFAVAY